MFQRVARVAFGIHNDHVGLQLCKPLTQEGVGRQRGNQVEAACQQANAQLARAFNQRQVSLIRCVECG